MHEKFYTHHLRKFYNVLLIVSLLVDYCSLFSPRKILSLICACVSVCNNTIFLRPNEI